MPNDWWHSAVSGAAFAPGFLPYALRASLRLFKIAPGDFVSLHAGVASEAHEREKLERLCRYITRPAVSTERLSLTTQGNIRYRLKTPYRDGTTDVVFEPLDKIAGSDFKQPQAGPQGEGQDAQSTLWPAWPHWCRRHGSTLRVTTASLRRTIGYVNK